MSFNYDLEQPRPNYQLMTPAAKMAQTCEYRVAPLATNPKRRYIGRKTAENAFHGRRYLEGQGQHYNQLLTINWSMAVKSEEGIERLHRAFRQRLLRAWRYRSQKTGGGPLHYLDVMENPEEGFHAHTALSIPGTELLWLENTVMKIIKKLVDAQIDDGMVDIRPITTAGSTFKYLLKGTSPAYESYFHMRTMDQGLIAGRRVSMSRSMGPTARERAGWKRARRPKSM